MGDSDEEYDRRRARDKFRRERSDYNERRREREERNSRRDDWPDRRRDQQGSWDRGRRGGGDYRDFDRGRRDSGGRHHELSPPIPKRLRRDWDDPYHGGGGDFGPYGGGGANAGGMPHHPVWNHPGGDMGQMQMGQDARQRSDGPSLETPPGPVMQTLKQFLATQDDNIDDMEAIRKYQAYKLDFKKTQLNDFFQQHKDEEWFRMRYHPREAAQRQKELQRSVRRRLNCFLELMEMELSKDLRLEVDHSDAIVKFLDAVVIKLEGGSDEDLAILDRSPSPSPDRRRQHSQSSPHSDRKRSNRHHSGSRSRSRSPSPKKISNDAAESLLEPISPSSVPLPDDLPPDEGAGDGKGFAALEPTVEQKELQQQAQHYKQQQIENQKNSVQPEQGPDQSEEPNSASDKKGEESKKKRKRHHREPYYFDNPEDESDSDSESDSESEPAPPGEEMSPAEVRIDEDLRPPGVEDHPQGTDSASTSTPMQLPSSSSTVTPTTTTPPQQPRPDSGDAAVGSSETESSEVSSGKPEQKTDGSEDGAVDSTQSPDSKPNKPDQSEESIKKDRSPISPAQQVESTDGNVGDDEVSSGKEGAVSAGNDQDVEMAPATSSDAVSSDVVMKPIVSEQVSPLPSTATEDQMQEVVDSNKLAEKKEVTEEVSPVKPLSTKESKENALEEKERDSAEEEGMASEGKELVPAGPRPLHKTYSLFMRNIPPSISKADIAAACKRFPGFLRVALSDPSPDRRFYRRGWITFDRSVDIKQINWDFNNIRIKEAELNPVINRDLSRRIRPVNGITQAKQVVRESIKLAADLIRVLDKKSAVYEKDQEKQEEQNGKEKETAEKKEEGEEGEEKPAEEKEPPLNIPNENPILASLSEDVAEEEGGEEMELLGKGSPPADGDGDKSEVDFTQDPTLLRVLDRMLLYLRVVHSMDYYNCGDYPHEDEMPNRCGIMHVRGPVPEKATLAEAHEWQKNTKQKLELFLQEKETVPDEEILKLGKKDPESEIEKFVEANTQELAKDKWLCPLSGKKFRGPEFVRKHIFNKHADQVEEVRMEVEFFNRFIADPKRPANPEPSAQNKQNSQPPMGQMFGQQHGGQGMMGWGPRPPMMMNYGPRAPFTPQSYGGGFGHDGYGGRGGHTFPPKPRRFGYAAGRNRQQERGFNRDPRQIVTYRDLDAPDDGPDLF
ncbi:serrate RNA effector molecule homolog isoform X2 [Nematostella vectensis]|uniref:serrate RNA effector molecule homolog isoform X2 n=1 Tax=Nematostella vectensis TaxID=45351 RepID=UPI002077752E|nr:serrate RNA effector molecule homolog isoform X2 [Nematostella vectensis]